MIPQQILCRACLTQLGVTGTLNSNTCTNSKPINISNGHVDKKRTDLSRWLLLLELWKNCTAMHILWICSSPFIEYCQHTCEAMTLRSFFIVTKGHSSLTFLLLYLFIYFSHLHILHICISPKHFAVKLEAIGQSNRIGLTRDAATNFYNLILFSNLIKEQLQPCI